MGIRVAINQRRGLGIGIAIGLIVFSLLALLFLMHQRGGNVTSDIPQAFYSEDDGKTWFVDEATKIVPFDHNGKQAVRAQIFRCGNGVPFVGFLERFSEATQARVARLKAQNPDSVWLQVSNDLMEVKKPGAARWQSLGGSKANMAEYHRILKPACPTGETSEPSPVAPSDANNGAIP